MPPRPEPLRVSDTAGAERLVAETLQRMQELEGVLERESAHIRVGRLREGLADEAHKTALAGAYLQGLEEVKANAVALARFTPAGVAALREAHRRFAAAIETNQAVLATARAVSESLMKSLSSELARAAQPQGYGARRAMPSPYGPVRATPLVLSRSL
ncbi:hypothetical protein [Methylobacterium nodulans]|uniref:FlgN family protein n=1 Tax=Methylobacterium nodulans (strain LMG 21967 / CNCM I-2342 / ORS 2060) TaxID=460265 RepID=B8IEJ7_METNO|nr:hypothetical protein [Methylobacterium nodulans]ACL59569.1 conserved hypothetical protein [Methylobacterium nodulans ORS 2060]